MFDSDVALATHEAAFGSSLSSDNHHHRHHESYAAQLPYRSPIVDINQEIRRKHVAAAAAVLSSPQNDMLLLSRSEGTGSGGMMVMNSSYHRRFHSYYSSNQFHNSDPWEDSPATTLYDPDDAAGVADPYYSAWSLASSSPSFGAATCVCRWTRRRSLSNPTGGVGSTAVGTSATPNNRNNKPPTVPFGSQATAKHPTSGIESGPQQQQQHQGLCPICGKPLPPQVEASSTTGFAWTSQGGAGGAGGARPASPFVPGNPRRSHHLQQQQADPAVTDGGAPRGSPRTITTAAAAVPPLGLGSSSAANASSWAVAAAAQYDEPHHAAALLQSTPQLRILSPASTDMQGAGYVPARGLLQQATSGAWLRLFSSHQNNNTDHHYLAPASQSTISSSQKDGGGGSDFPILGGKGHSAQASSHATAVAGGGSTGMSDYKASLVRDHANQQAATELASLLWVLAHEMSLEDYGTVESTVFTSVFALVHNAEKERRMAGLAALDALLAAPSADEEKKAIKFANTLSNGLRAAHGDFEFLSAVSKALGHMATRTANVDFVESEVTRALEWLGTERSDRRLAACLTLKEFAIHAPTTFHSKTSQSTLGQGGSNEFLDHIFQAVRDPQPIVRACASDALSQCLKILVERRHLSLTGLLCQVHFAMMEGLNEDTSSKKRPWHAIAAAEASQHGSLLVVATMLAHTRDFMLPRFEEVCRAVFSFTTSSKALIRLEVVRLIPRLARHSPAAFGRRFLDRSLTFLIESASKPTPPRVGVDIRPSAYTAMGQLILAMTDETTGQVIGGSNSPTMQILDDPDSPGSGHIVELCHSGVIYQKLGEIFALVRKGLRQSPSAPPSSSSKGVEASTLSPALHCGASLVEALGDLALPYISDLIDDMFRAGLSTHLIQCLYSIALCVPKQQSQIEERMLQEVSVCLTGLRDVYDPLTSFRASLLQARAMENVQNRSSSSRGAHYLGSTCRNGNDSNPIVINGSADPITVRSLVLSLQTLASFGGMQGRVTTAGAVVPLLPFVQDVAARYLVHPSSEVRRAAALTCCALLIPHGSQGSRIGSYSGLLIEGVLERLLRVAVSDPSPIVRLCVVLALDTRYESFLSQSHHLQELFVLLQDEALATRAAGLRLLGRLASINPAPILPVMRSFLDDIIVELQCGVENGRGREEATRLLVVFLKAKPLQRLIHPVLPSLITALPLDEAAPPRLASASLEALGELAQATGIALQPWVKEVVPHVLEILQDQSSASKQRTSLHTLGQIAGSTGYVIRPYLEYPKLLVQATDVLPATKRAPWSLRREVIRTLGILGALDPDRYNLVASKARKGGAVGGAYFEEIETNDIAEQHIVPVQRAKVPSSTPAVQDLGKGADLLGESDDDLPASLFMYEQYAMVSQPVSTLPPAKRMTPTDEDFYPTVSIQALMRIFRDPSLAVHHGMVIQAVMFIFKSLGLKCVPYLSMVVPRMLYTVRTCNPFNLRESLLQQLATLSMIVREHLRPFVPDIFDVVEQFWATRHLATILNLVAKIAAGAPDEFPRFVPRLVRRLLSTLDELQITDWSSESPKNLPSGRGRVESEKLRLILQNISNLKGVLGSYLHVIIPSLLSLANSLVSLTMAADSGLAESMLVELTVLVFKTISTLLETHSTAANRASLAFYADQKHVPKGTIENGLSSRVIQPIVRLLRDKPPRSPAVGLAMVETLCVAAEHVGGPKWVQLYDGSVRSAISGWQATFQVSVQCDIPAGSIRIDNRISSCLELYDEVIEDMQLPTSLRQQPVTNTRRNSFMLPDGYNIVSSEFSVVGAAIENQGDAYDQHSNPVLQTLSSAHRQKVNQSKLQRAWDVSQRSSRDDWEEWMRRLAIQLLREAPSPALRATANLAHAYQPLARELFSAAFACCWKELSEPYRLNLVHALETAFVADVSPEILQALLNLAEFMEHDPRGGLPIEIPILAQLALKCRAYAKALHYKEREFTFSRSNACVESLISINRKLDLQEAALGVLKVSSLGEALTEGIRTGEELSTKFSRHQAYEMFYSVIWSTEDRLPNQNEKIDISAKEELWLAKLGSWSEALAVYKDKLRRDPNNFEALLGCMRCLIAGGEWRKVLDLAEENWHAMDGSSGQNHSLRDAINPRSRRKAVRLCAQASWRLGQWEDMEMYTGDLVSGVKTAQSSKAASGATVSLDNIGPRDEFDASFYAGVLHIHKKEWAHAADAIDAARRAMDGQLTALMAESYSRAYPSMVTAQTLAEMEEIVDLKKVEERSKLSSKRHPVNRPNEGEARNRLLSVWRDRLAGCRVDAEVVSSILAVRSLVLGPCDEIESTLSLSELSRQAQRFRFAERVLLDPLDAMDVDINGPTFGFGVTDNLLIRPDFSGSSSASIASVIDRVLAGNLGSIIPTYGANHEQWSKSLVSEAGGIEKLVIQYRLYFAYVKHLWSIDRKDEAMGRLGYLCDIVDMVSHCESVQDTSLRVGCFLEFGEWKIAQATSPNSVMTDSLQADVLTTFKRATQLKNCGYRAWHAWALLNFRIALQKSDFDDAKDDRDRSRSDKVLRNHVVAAVEGFASAISIGTKKWTASVQQDLLNLLTCLFRFGRLQDVAVVINGNIGKIAIEAWLGVLPQLLARIHIKDTSIRSVLHPLLTRIGEKHPQALMYPLSVLLKSPVGERKNSAESLMTSLKSHSSELVEEALMVSSELIRVAILWLETWHEGLEDASRLYFGEGNVAAMLDLLIPLHAKLEEGAATRREGDFLKSFGQDLAQAHHHIKEYIKIVREEGSTIPSGQGSIEWSRQSEQAETAMNRAWDIYYTVFRRINKQLPSLTKLELTQCSPALSRARSLELGVPGSYRVDGSYVKIEKFVPSVEVITSKQRPRKITLRGSDGLDYVFLLKGHEDLRQDERVMQLFGLVNALLVRDPQTKKHDLKIQRYAICPLSHNCGVVGWVPHTDTLHSLIRDYRQSKKIPLNMENLEMQKITPDFDSLTVMQKVEVFTVGLKRTTGRGNDLYEILWLKSTNSEEWLERRTKFTRSLAVMSMVGYILGLGDRHPSNLMLDKISGRVLHIDFGDCFEVAMNREKFPEKVPFRLTRMLIKATEVSGIEGSYRSTCERTMTVLRDSRDSLVAMLEAFVYDPLISWRLADLSQASAPSQNSTTSAARNRHDDSRVNGGGNNGMRDNGNPGNGDGIPIELAERSNNNSTMVDSIVEDPDEDDMVDDDERQDRILPERPRTAFDGVRQSEATRGVTATTTTTAAAATTSTSTSSAISASRARSLQMYANMQTWAATDARIASITGERSVQVAAEGSIARSRIERSMRHREFMSLIAGEDGAAHEEALNEKALRVIRRVQDKLSGTDFPDCDGEPLDVTDQVQRLIVQATSSENLCQLFVGWCSFW